MTNGRIAEYAIHVSDDGQQWSDPVASGTFPRGAASQTVRFPQPRSARFLKLAVKREVDGKPYASAAEIDLLLADQPMP